MPALFAIRYDGTTYQELDLEITDLFDMIPEEMSLHELMDFCTTNTPMSIWWETPQTEFTCVPANPRGVIPDISIWIKSSLVLSPKAYRCLKDSLESLGEFLPVLVNGEEYKIFNCLNIVDADRSSLKYVQEEGIELGISHLEFPESATKHRIFKCPDEACLTLFCNQQFKNAVRDFDLNGISFDENLLLKSPFK